MVFFFWFSLQQNFSSLVSVGLSHSSQPLLSLPPEAETPPLGPPPLGPPPPAAPPLGPAPPALAEPPPPPPVWMTIDFGFEPSHGFHSIDA